jgi:hypothetical protein
MPIKTNKFLIKPAWDGLQRILVRDSGIPITIDTIVDHTEDGHPLKILGGSAPHKPSSEGFVTVSLEGEYYAEYYASVYNLKWDTVI